MSNASQSFLRYLRTGKQVTPKQVRTMFKVENPHDLVYRLRTEGHSIYTNRVTLKDGTKTFGYRLGNPSERFVKLAKANRIADARKSLYQAAING